VPVKPQSQELPHKPARVAGSAWDASWDSPAEPPAAPWSREQAQALRAARPSLSPWLVLAVQLAAGMLVAAATWLVTGAATKAGSAFYGALAVVVPGAVFARGVLSKVALMNPGAAVAGFFLWELVKVGLTIAMLFAAPRVVPGLSWPAMLVGLVVAMKVVWLVVALDARRQRSRRG
jgi:ATP synthase protein I